MRRWLTSGLLLCMVTAKIIAAEAPADDTEGRLAAFADAIKFTSKMQVLSEFDNQGIQSSSLNPGNQIAKLVGSQYLLEFRPDFTAAFDRFSFAISPRLTTGDLIDTSFPAPDQGFVHNAYVNTWRAKMQVTPDFSVSYGREVVQWGNGVFRSPSNPFFADNGRTNPVVELGGREFAIATYNPSLNYGVTFLVNTGQGLEPPADSTTFYPTMALKLDYVGDAVNASVIASKHAHESLRMGGFATWTATDSLLVYGEGTGALGSLALYPTPGPPFGTTLAPVLENSGRLIYTMLLGSTYTFENGISLTGEYINNNDGYTGKQQKALTALSRQATSAFLDRGENAGIGAELLGGGIDNGLRLERRNYLFLQLLRTEYKGVADIALRYAQNLDDSGGQLSTAVTYFLNKRSQLYFVGTYNIGPADSEFSHLQRYTAQLGVRFFL